MYKPDIKFDTMTFPSSEEFRVFRVLDDVIWQIISPKAYNIDTGEEDYIDMIFEDPVTAEIICDYLNEAEDDIYG